MMFKLKLIYFKEFSMKVIVFKYSRKKFLWNNEFFLFN